MRTDQAKALIAMLQALFPRFPIPDPTFEAWAMELSRTSAVPRREEAGAFDVVDVWGFDEAQVAISELARTWPDEHYPGLQAIIAKVREVRGSTMSPALPAPELDPREASRSRARMREIVAQFFTGREHDRIAAEIRAGIADPVQVDQHTRAMAGRMLAEAEAIPPTSPPDVARLGARLPACSGVGRPWVIDEAAGVKRCPCGSRCVEMPLNEPWPLVPEDRPHSRAAGRKARADRTG